MKFIKLYARNIVNNDKVKEYLLELSKNIEKPEIKKWINSNLKNYIQNDLETVKKVTKFKDSDPDWLKDSVKNGTALEVEFKEEFKDQLSLILQYFESEDVELKKLPKLDFDPAFFKATLWARKVEEDNKRKLSEIPEDFAGIEVVREYSDKFCWVRLSTQKALNREGHLMNHCTKKEEMGYLQGIKSGILEIFSLRDEKNIPHCTMEIRKTLIKQIKGYSNGAIREKYVEKVKNFINKPIKNKKFDNIGDLINIGYIEQDGKWHNIYNLQPNFTVKGNLDLSNTTVEKLPKNLIIWGQLKLSPSMKILPENLEADYLSLSETDVKELPKSLKVKELNLFQAGSITELPENLDLDYLCLTETNIKELPKGLKVKEELDLSNSYIRELPENLEVEVLSLEGSRIREIPKSLKVKELDLTSCRRIKILPDNLKLDYLSLIETNIEELPKKLTVKQLDLGKTKIKELPEDIKVHLLYTNEYIKDFPKGVKKVDKRIYMG